jgi:dTDP-glucose 4,6-dehydratase
MKKNNEKILITGGAGFVGHHMIEYFLKHTNYDIVSLDRLDTSGNLNRLADILKNNKESHRVKIVWHDLKAPLNDFVINDIGKNVKYIFHVAAASHVDRSISRPIEFVQDNVLGTANILEYARIFCKNIKMFLYFSTDEVFGPAPNGFEFSDNDRFACKNPYSATKAGGEELSMAYENTYNLPIVVTHTMNIYGKRQHPEKFIPLVIRKILQNEVIEIHSNTDLSEAGRRHYLHSDDLCEAMLFLMKNFKSGEKYNIVSEDEISNLDMAKMVAEILNKELKYIMVDPKTTRPRFDFRYACDGSKLKNMGWQSKTKLKDGIIEIINWFENNENWLHLNK